VIGADALNEAMIEETIARRGLTDPALLDALRAVPRHRFLPAESAFEAYEDHPVGIGFGQTASQPYVVAWMLHLAGVRAGTRLLEVGVGCGWLLALAVAMGARAVGVERQPALAARAAASLRAAGLPADVRCADGADGWHERGPFDAIVVSCASEDVAPGLLAQRAPGGRVVAPVGGDDIQRLLVWSDEGVEDHGAVRFVPMRRGMAV
jgi:protein-L-isoaspartate(D-aspartate) O-methyltransferase